METLTASAESEAAIQADLEESLNQALASELLYCPYLGYSAGGEDTGIVEFNPLPVDMVAHQSNL